MKKFILALSIGLFLALGPAQAEPPKQRNATIFCFDNPNDIVNVLESRLGEVFSMGANVRDSDDVIMVFYNPETKTVSIAIYVRKSEELCLVMSGVNVQFIEPGVNVWSRESE